MSASKAFHQKAADALRNKHTIVMILFLTLATLVAYGNSLQNGFVWDDHDIIVNNAVNRDIANFFSLFSSADSTVAGNQKTYYRPLNRLTYMLDYQLFGLHPAGYHFVNILIHLMTVILLYFVARELFTKSVPAFIAALIFAVHPVNTEAVNFISARNSSLAAFFVLLTLMTYLHAQAENNKSSSYLSGLFFLMGLLCKEQAIMLPFVLLIFEMVKGRKDGTSIKARLLPLLPFALATAIYLVLRIHALSTVVGGYRITDGLWGRILQNIYVIPKYAMIILFPLRLNAFYSLPHDYLAKAAWLVLLWIVIIATFLVIDKERAATKFGLLWLAINFVPISNIVPIPSAPIAERYLYLPAIGLWLIAADQAYRLYGRFAFKRTLIASGAAIIICLAVITVNRNGDWRDDITFYSRMAETNPDSALAHFSLGLAYRERDDLQQAQAEWKRTAEIDPRYFNVFAYLGDSYIQINSLEQAEYYYKKEIEVNPDDAVTIYNMAVLKEKLHKPHEALLYYERFIKMQPHADENILAKVNARITFLKKTAGIR